MYKYSINVAFATEFFLNKFVLANEELHRQVEKLQLNNEIEVNFKRYIFDYFFIDIPYCG